MTLWCAICMALEPDPDPRRRRPAQEADTIVNGHAVCGTHMRAARLGDFNLALGWAQSHR